MWLWFLLYLGYPGAMVYNRNLSMRQCAALTTSVFCDKLCTNNISWFTFLCEHRFVLKDRFTMYPQYYTSCMPVLKKVLDLNLVTGHYTSGLTLNTSKLLNKDNRGFPKHYSDVIMGEIASQITSLIIVFSTFYSDTYQRKRQSSSSLAFV